jgi:hypothetical protein
MFVLKEDKTLIEMKPASFASESDFQLLLEQFPALLSGGQIDRQSPRRWILVAREMPVPSDDGSGGRWSVDHLFVDQDGIATIVEVKRQSDTRIRREVVGQMLDYAANGVAYWPVEEIKTRFEARCEAGKLEPIEEMARLLGPDGNTDEFWERVKTNLQAGKIRMLFVADQIPPELRKIVEFLNRQMDPAEVLALELSQFEGEGGLKTLVPRVYGQTEEAQQKKGVKGPQRDWDEGSVYQDMEQRFGPQPVEVARKIVAWMRRARPDQIWFGHGKTDGSIGTTFVRNGFKFYPLQVNSNARLYINFGYCLKRPFDDASKRSEWLNRLNLAGINLPESAIDKFPSVQLILLKEESHLAAFLEAMDWFVSQLRESGDQA